MRVKGISSRMEPVRSWVERGSPPLLASDLVLVRTASSMDSVCKAFVYAKIFHEEIISFPILFKQGILSGFRNLLTDSDDQDEFHHQ